MMAALTDVDDDSCFFADDILRGIQETEWRRVGWLSDEVQVLAVVFLVLLLLRCLG